MSLKTILAITSLLVTASTARAQVLITELQPNVIGSNDLGEWIEIQNLGTATVSLGGYTISDSSGGVEIDNRYALPATASVAPGQVIIITRQATQFMSLFPMVTPDYELADQADEPSVPNITRLGMGGILQLSNSQDAIYLRDAMGVLVSAVEYGMDFATVPGAPFPAAPNPKTGPVANASLTRVMTSGSSQVDFTDRFAASPGVGYSPLSGPSITNARSTPRHIAFGQPYTITASVTSTDPLRNVSFFFAAATSSSADAMEEFTEFTPTLSATATYSYSANIEAFAAGHGFGAPADFHSRFVRWFITAQDVLGSGTVVPSMATEAANNRSFLPSYLQNVLPEAATPIAQARVEAAGGGGPRWANLSVRVRGVAIVGPNVIQPGRLQFALVDDSNAGISVFDAALLPGNFSFVPGSVVEVTGTLNAFRGLTQIGQNAEITVTGDMAPVPTTTVTIQQILTGGNEWESRLVHIEGVEFMAPRATWPTDDMASGSWNVRVTDGTGELTLRVTPGARGVFAEAAPQFGFHVTGVVGEFDGSWQLFPRSDADITAKPMPPAPDAGPSADAAGGGDGGGGGRDGGTAGNDASTGDPFVPTPSEDGCSCGAAPVGTRAPGTVFLAVLTLAGVVLSRRRRS